MTSMLMELYDALISAGAADTKARAAAAVVRMKDLSPSKIWIKVWLRCALNCVPI